MPEKYLILPALCSYAYSTHYAQNYASIIRKTLRGGPKSSPQTNSLYLDFGSVNTHFFILKSGTNFPVVLVFQTAY